VETRPDPTLSTDPQHAFYDTFWAERPPDLNSEEVQRLAKILEAYAMILGGRSAPQGGFEICDLGCGVGWISAELAKFGRVTGVDLSPEGVRIATARWPSINFIVADILSWRPTKQFDIVVSSEVIEHIEEKEQFADTVSALVRPGGYLILTTPNKYWKAAAFAGGARPQTIEAWASPSQLRRLFSRNFVVLRHETFILDFAYSGLLRITSAPKALRMLDYIGVRPIYDGLRIAAKMGLYQLLVARKRGG
jgi:SAM-dependent methyltransferase